MRKKSQDIPIIFLTSLPSELEDYMMAYSSEAINYLTKPFHPETLVELMGGTISASSHPGDGTMFSFTIPSAYPGSIAQNVTQR